MALLLKIFFGFTAVLLCSGGFVYGVYRGLQELQKRFPVIEGNGPKALEETPPMERAEMIANRIRASIKRDRDEGGELAADFESEVTAILEKRLPRILKNRERLEKYIGRLDVTGIDNEPKKIQKRLSSCDDDELKAVLEKNLKLALERKDNLHHLQTLQEKTEAQIKLVLLGLQNLEDKVESLHLVEGMNDAVAGALDNVREEVDILEKEYRQMEARYDD